MSNHILHISIRGNMSYLVLIVYFQLELITQLFEKISHFRAEHTPRTDYCIFMMLFCSLGLNASFLCHNKYAKIEVLG